MSTIKQKAIQMIENLPDDKVQALINLAADELILMRFQHNSEIRDKRQAFARLEKLNLNIPEGFDVKLELSQALGEKYDIDN